MKGHGNVMGGPDHIYMHAIFGRLVMVIFQVHVMFHSMMFKEYIWGLNEMFVSVLNQLHTLHANFQIISQYFTISLNILISLPCYINFIASFHFGINTLITRRGIPLLHISLHISSARINNWNQCVNKVCAVFQC